MAIVAASRGREGECERVLRSLPQWFGIEESLQAYARDAGTLPTFVSEAGGGVDGFITLQRHFETAFEVHCLAVHADSRGTGIGRALLAHASAWAVAQGGRFLQVKTLAAGHPSAAYAETRAFYERAGFVPLEVFATLWSTAHPCLQLIKVLPDGA